MSRRFGRNQKRRARQEMARLASDLQDTGTQLTEAREDAARRGRLANSLVAEIDRAKDMLPEHSALMRPQAFPVEGAPREQVMMTTEAPTFIGWDLGAPMDGTVTMAHVPLDILLTDVQPDQLTRKLHARVAFAGVDLIYGISAEARDSMPVRDLADRLATELARQFAPALVKALATKGR